jgi:hypothetical protein
VVAANHVHVLVTPHGENELSAILHSWKSFTAHKILKVEAASRRLSAALARLGGFRSDFAKIEIFSLRKWLILRKSSFEKALKGLVVQTYPIPRMKNLRIIPCRHVSALQHSKKKRQAPPILEHRRKQTRFLRQSRATARALPW